jgi:ABC-type amino acid transport substrate-binding protein
MQIKLCSFGSILGAGLGLLLPLLSGAACADVIKYNQSPVDPNGYYAAKMIKLALEHVDRKYEHQIVEGALTQVRMVEDTLNGTLDIMWAGTSVELEEALQPIRIPLYKGLLGHRFLIIRKGDQPKFDHIKTLDDLRKVKLGQGTSWVDTKILEGNGLQVVKTMKYQNLFHMLDGGRFDAFPRAVFEPFSEVEKNSNLNLTVEKNIMLVYKMDFYLFVNKKNKQLAKDLEQGLNAAIADGSFEKLFMTSPNVQEAVQKGDLKNRTIINLVNPVMPKETPVDRAELWIDPKTM